jgi:D-alanyl-D-alanine carboxypeptidase/D-alanyl-D-alanine-endopeptidase (penicillin-binding protein 4)
MRLLAVSILLVLSSCSIEKQISKSAKENVLNTKALSAAHVGISVYEPATGKYWFNFQGDKYFVPASNTKIPTCYAAMKYLGDSLVAARYLVAGKTIFVRAAADPTFLHPDFDYQPLLQLLKSTGDEIKISIPQSFTPLGSGWAWNDYDQSYMAERSSLPMYGNVIWLSEKPIYPKNLVRDTIMDSTKLLGSWRFWVKPKYFTDKIFGGSGISMQREKDRNKFYVDKFTGTSTIPFVSGDIDLDLLSSVIDKPVGAGDFYGKDRGTVLHSQPTDSVLSPMMHRSDNFFAEQTLLMVSNQRLGVMSDEQIIDTLLKTDFKDLPQKPRWADGSGLSRYNLFTPQDFVAILNKMKNEFGMNRIKVILPTGGEGTISSYYKNETGYIYGKTGTLSGVVAFSGYLYTKKGKLLIFSTLVNNHQASATDVRRAMEKFLVGIRNNY